MERNSHNPANNAGLVNDFHLPLNLIQNEHKVLSPSRIMLIFAGQIGRKPLPYKGRQGRFYMAQTIPSAVSTKPQESGISREADVDSTVNIVA
jgi:hypothetical protein